MTNKIQYYKELAEQTAIQMIGDEVQWKSFLNTSARIYKNPYHDQLLIYAQYPEATACASFDFWNKEMGRYVRRGSKGIALIDFSRGYSKLKYVFDVSQTGSRESSRDPYIWQYRSEHENAVTYALERRFGVIGGNGIVDQLEQLSEHLAREYWREHSYDLSDILADSILGEYDEYIREKVYEKVATVSTFYFLLSRCGIQSLRSFDSEDFIGFSDFSSPEAIMALGATVSEIGEDVLRQIEEVVRKYEREKITERNKNHERIDLHEERGLSDSRPGIERANPSSPGEIRQDEEELSERASSGAVEPSASVGTVVSPPAGDRRNSEPSIGADDAGIDEVSRGDGGTEIRRSDEVGGTDEHPQSSGGGNDSGRIDLSVNSEEPFFQSGQLSLFPSEEEQIQYIAEAESASYAPFALSFSQEEIDHFLRLGSNADHHRLKIIAEFSKQKSTEDNAEYLKNLFHGGNGIKIGEKSISAWYTEEGIRLAKGNSARYAAAAQMISWMDAAMRIGELLDAGQYATNMELAEAFRHERTLLARSILYLYHDLSDNAKKQGYLSGLNQITGRGYPADTAYFSERLEDPVFRNSLSDEYEAFFVAYQQDRDLLRFHYHRPKELWDGLKELSVMRREFLSEMSQLPEVKQFITEDEINAALSAGSSFVGGKGRIYDYFREFHTLKEQADFLKHEYGIGGYSHALSGASGSDESHNGKGITYEKRDCPKVIFNWNQVAKRINELIRKGQYITLEEFSEQESAKVEEKHEPSVSDAVDDTSKEHQDTLQKPTPFSDYNDIKHEHKDELVLYQVGDFFELYGEDAKTAAEKLNLHLTNRIIPDVGRVSMCGFPVDTLEQYTERLREDYGVTIAATQNGSNDRNVYSLAVINREPLQPVSESEPEASSLHVPQEQDVSVDQEQDSMEVLDGSPASVRIDGEWQTFPNTANAEKAMYEESKAEIRRNAQNFHITDDNLGVGSSKTKYQANINAIKLLKELESDGRQALPEQQEVLSCYVGWGGLADVFDPSKENWRNEYAELKELLTPEEYESARSSTLNAHYTSPTVIKAIYEAVGNMGFKAGNILEPSMGVGNFFGMLPEEMQVSRLYGVELDSITGRIAKQLYPKANITVAGFETTDRRDFFDLAIGNVPFGNYRIDDRAYNKLGFSIHDYFFAKSLDQVRPGGLIAFVTSRYTMDKQSPEVRKHIAQRAELLGAIRLPNNAFKTNAGTEVVSDILFLQKRDHPIDIEPEWVHLGLNDDGFAINSYFINHPEMILGRQTSESTQYGRQDFTVTPIEGLALSDQLHDAVKYIQGTYKEVEFVSVDEIDTSLPADPNVKNYSYAVIDGEVYYRENSRMVRPDLNATAAERIKGMVTLRECVNELIDLQMDEYCSESEIQEKQGELNRLYDGFTKKYGLINDRGNRLAFSADSSYFLLCSLEILDDDGNLKRKADMFTKRTIKQRSHIESVDTASEALTVSISEKACVDLEYMASLLGGSEKIPQIVEELRGVIFKDPQSGAFDLDSDGDCWNKGWQTADEYLSGNVRQKLRSAQAAAERDRFFTGNVEALMSAQPKDLDASEIEVHLGATWLDKEYIQQFMYETFDTPRHLRDEITVNFVPYTSEWQVSRKNLISAADVAAYTTYGTDRANAYRILEDSLNLRDIRIYDTVEDADGKERRVLNSKETTLAAQKQQLIRDAFKDWIWKDPERREKLVRKYNDEMNCIRPREYDGSHITFPGMNPEITLREHQVNAVAHVLYGGNTLLAHEVGAGKTFEMIAAAMESKRLGLCHKSIFVVPNHLTEQWASEFLRLYPSANILVTTKKDFETHNRKKFCARIATGDYDAVIIGHSQFERIPISAERQERLLREQIEEITDGIQEVKNSNGENFTVKSLERTKKSLEARLKKLQDTERKDDVVTFEQLGVDRMFVDESDNYKNLYLYTKMRNVAGLSTTDALKSSDMFVKCRYLDELTDSRGVIFATGTPISNSITELYTIQRYLQHDRLQEMGMLHFDSWASCFGETTTALELAPEGTGYRTRTRFAKFFNLPELMNLFKEVADIKTSDQLDLPTPEVEYHTFASKPTETQKGMVLALSERASKVHSGSVDASVDNMLKITSDGRKLGLDQRILNPMLPDEDMTKVNQCVRNILQYWHDGESDKLTQLVFCDISTPKSSSHRAAKTLPGNLDDAILLEEKEESPFTVYEDIRKKLILGGMAQDQIAFIHDANTEVKKRELFAKVRNGQVRVLIGSTAKMGAGTNVQDRLIALHDLDCPWRPRDLTQRKGRIERQGNQNKRVHVCRYVTEGTFDAYLWQTVETKQRFISQIMTSKSPVRSCEDVDATALSFAEIKALCAGDPRIKERMDLDVEVSKLKIMKADHQSKQYRLEDDLLRYYPNKIEEKKGFIRGFESDMRMLSSHPLPAEGFVGMEIRGDILTDKENAGAALLDSCKEVKNSDPVSIGSYRGFAMSVCYNFLGQDYTLTLKGEMHHNVKLGSDARGNLIRIENVLDKMAERLQDVRDQLDDLYNQQAAAKAESGKPFPQEKELSEKTARLIELDMELNLDGKGQSRSEEVVAKSARPSVLDKLKASFEKERPEKCSSRSERGMVL